MLDTELENKIQYESNKNSAHKVRSEIPVTQIINFEHKTTKCERFVQFIRLVP